MENVQTQLGLSGKKPLTVTAALRWPLSLQQRAMKLIEARGTTFSAYTRELWQAELARLEAGNATK
jgi:predicted DNA-binding protein